MWTFPLSNSIKRANLGYFFHLYYLVGKTMKLLFIKISVFLFPSLHLIVKQNYRSKWITEDFGYVKVHEIALLLVPDMLSYNCFLGLVLISLH